MRVNQVEEDTQAHPVGGVDQFLQLLRRAEARRDRIKIAHVIAEGAVVGVLLNGHELDGVVAQVGDARQDVFGELGEAADLSFFLGHADVGFVDAQTLGARRIGMAKLIRRRRAPILADEAGQPALGHDPADVGGDAVHVPRLFMDDVDFDARAVRELVAEFFVGEE